MSHQPDNIFAGTQVVSLVEVRGTNDSLVHPRGAVGVVTRTPTGDQTQFLVRFPDGFEASFTRENLEVLKHFKDRLGEVGRVTPCAPPSVPAFELEQFILYRCVVGARAYGLDHDDSDTDRRGTRSPCPHRSRLPNCKVAVRKHLFGAPEQFEDNAKRISMNFESNSIAGKLFAGRMNA